MAGLNSGPNEQPEQQPESTEAPTKSLDEQVRDVGSKVNEGYQDLKSNVIDAKNKDIFTGNAKKDAIQFRTDLFDLGDNLEGLLKKDNLTDTDIQNAEAQLAKTEADIARWEKNLIGRQHANEITGNTTNSEGYETGVTIAKDVTEGLVPTVQEVTQDLKKESEEEYEEGQTEAEKLAKKYGIDADSIKRDIDISNNEG